MHVPVLLWVCVVIRCGERGVGAASGIVTLIRLRVSALASVNRARVELSHAQLCSIEREAGYRTSYMDSCEMGVSSTRIVNRNHYRVAAVQRVCSGVSRGAGPVRNLCRERAGVRSGATTRND